MLDVYLLQVFNGLSVGSILLLVALGLAFSFGLMGVINMAHGELMALGAYSTFLMQGWFAAYLPARFDLYFLVALPLKLPLGLLLAVGAAAVGREALQQRLLVRLQRAGGEEVAGREATLNNLQRRPGRRVRDGRARADAENAGEHAREGPDPVLDFLARP